MKNKYRNVYAVLEQNNFNIKAHGPFYEKKEAEAFNAALMYSNGVKGKIVTFESWDTSYKITASFAIGDIKVQEAMIKEGKKIR